MIHYIKFYWLYLGLAYFLKKGKAAGNVLEKTSSEFYYNISVISI